MVEISNFRKKIPNSELCRWWEAIVMTLLWCPCKKTLRNNDKVNIYNIKLSICAKWTYCTLIHWTHSTDRTCGVFDWWPSREWFGRMIIIQLWRSVLPRWRDYMCPSENYRFDPNNLIVLLSFPSALQSGVGGCNSRRISNLRLRTTNLESRASNKLPPPWSD